jgi:hypothetical protein
MIMNLFKSLKSRIKLLDQLPGITKLLESHILNDLKNPKVNLGQIQAHLNSLKPAIRSLDEVEFQVYSQWGDDGIIQYLISKIDFPHKTFIEFGVENYRESNTRFLLINNHWSGFIIDGSEKNIEYVKRDIISWACDLTAEAAFINKENINSLLLKSGFEPEVGILSIDIDGNDYWIWDEINVIDPILVIAEYNSLFGVNNAWTIPYNKEFVRPRDYSKMIYFGASLKAFLLLADKKGYVFVGCNSKGNNAYFVRKDKMQNLSGRTLEEGYRIASFREAVVNGKRISRENRINSIEGMEVFDLEKNAIVKISSENIKYN